MVFRPAADSLNAGDGAVFMNGVLLLCLLICLLPEDLFDGSALLAQLLVQVSLEDAVVECLQNAINMVANINFTVRIDQILAQRLEELR